jgi:mannose-6-phosphate isomerase
LWGGNKLLSFKGLPACDESIGESWELSAMPGRESVVATGEDSGLTLTQLVNRHGADLVGEDVYRRYGNQFPLLIKFIDAKRDLSIQVHPDDEMAHRLHGCEGKNEMWYILQADSGAIIRTGFNRNLSPEEFDRRLDDGSILDVINQTESQPGDVFFIPAGQIHTIGAGNFLVEIQQSSDITYRVWDYNRRDAEGNLRQLHVKEAREAITYVASEGKVQGIPRIGVGLTRLVECPVYSVQRLEFEDAHEWSCPEPHNFVAVVCIHGETTMEADDLPPVTLSQGETALIPAAVNRVVMKGTARLLLATVPIEK